MEVIYFLIPLSVLFVIGIAAVLIWAVRSGQYDDMERGRNELLMDDDSIDGDTHGK